MFAEVGASGWYILGEQVREFELRLATYWGGGCAVGVASGLDALEISLKVLGCRPGDRVLTTPISAFATTLAIVKVGAIPVFADTTDQGQLDLNACADLLERRRDIRYFIPVHLFGNPLPPGELRTLRDRFELSIIEDCAQSIGASTRGEYRREFTGQVGQMAATSFYPTKNLGAMGDAGAILTPDAKLAEQAKALRDYGQSAKYRHEWIGYNSRLDELHAALLAQVFLPRLDAWTQRRRDIAGQYDARLVNPHVRALGLPTGACPSRHLYPVLVAPDRRDALLAYLRAQGIVGGVHYPVAIPDQPAMQAVPFEQFTNLMRAREFCRREVSLPLHPYLLAEEVERVIAVVNAWSG